ncbi:MAG: histidine kinase [Cyclobacteriaceae bacterium]
MKNFFLSLSFLSISISLLQGQDFNEFLNRGFASRQNPDSADHYFSQAQSMINGPFHQMRYHHFMFYYHNWHSRSDSAIYHGEEKVRLALELDSVWYARSGYDNLTFEYRRIGLYEKALEQSQKLYELGLKVQDTLIMAEGLSSQAITNHDFEEYALGSEYGKRALSYLVNTPKATFAELQTAINSVGINYDDWGKMDSAIFYHNKVFEYLDRPDVDTISLKMTYNNIGNSYLKLKDYLNAGNYLRKAHQLNKLFHSRHQNQYEPLATTLTNLGNIKLAQANYDSAKYFLDLAESYADSSASVEKLRDIYDQQYKFHREKGDLNAAMDYLNKFYSIRDSVYNQDRAKSFAGMEIRFQTAQKEKEIEIQQLELAEQELVIQRNRIIQASMGFVLISLVSLGFLQRNRLKLKQKSQIAEERRNLQEQQLNAVIRSIEGERKRFSEDLHDGFGQLISILKINVDSLQSGKPNIDKRSSLFNQSTEILGEMYDELKNICFNLMPKTLIQNGLDAALKELGSQVNRSGQLRVDVNIQGFDGERLEDIQEISFYRITQEWVNNCLKYSDASNLSIQLFKDKNEIELIIEDNGTGFDLQKFKNSNSNGWKNIASRTNLMKGEVSIDTQTGRIGSTLIVLVNLGSLAPQPTTKFV